MIFRLTMIWRQSGGGRSLTRRMYPVAAMAIAAVAGAVPGASASSSAPATTAVLEDCQQRAVLVPGVERAVRRRVPGRFELVRDPLGRPLTFVVAARCARWAVGDSPARRTTTFAFFVAIIEPPDGGGCGSRWPVVGELKPDLLPLCDFYNFFVAYDNREVVHGQRALIPDFPVYYVREHVFRDDDFDPTRLGVPFYFRAAPGTEGPGTPSPFTLDAVAREGSMQTPPNLSPIFSFWWPGPSGTSQGFRIEDAEFAPGQMSAKLRVAPGSEMAELLGSETPVPMVSFANLYSGKGTFLPPGGRSVAPRPGFSLTGLRLSRKRFRAARRGGALAPRGRGFGHRVGTRVRYRLSSDATVTFRVQRARILGGRIVGYRTLRGKFTHVGHRGLNRLRWTGRLRRSRLGRGRYRLIALARRADVRSQQVRARFRILGAESGVKDS